MLESNDQQHNQSHDWQKADTRILGQIMVAQNIVFALPDTTRIAEFYAQTLISIPGIIACRICLEDVTIQRGEINTEVCADCLATRKKAATQPGTFPFMPNFNCQLSKQPDLQVNTINTFQRHFGFLIFQSDNLSIFNIYRPFIENLASYVAISLENRWQRDLLQQAHDDLERKVAERTQDLRIANQHLQTEIETRQQAEETLHHINRELRAISNCNQILLRAEDEQTLLNKICHIVCDEAGYHMAWVGYAENDDAKTVRPVAWAGSEAGYLANARITWDDTELGRGPTGTAIRAGKTFCIQDFKTDDQVAPWREAASRRGYRSSIAVPLQNGDKGTFGAFNVYSKEPNAFTPDEIRLMEELAGDLAFGVSAMRMRAERSRAEKALRESETKFRAVFENSVDAIGVSKSGIHAFVNPAYLTLFGYDDNADLDGKTVLELIAPTQREQILEIIRRRASGQPTPIAYETRGLRKDGSEFDMDVHVSTYELNGEIYTVPIIRDITERKQVEDALWKSSQMLKLVLDNMPAFVFWKDRNSVYLGCNHLFAANAGLSSPEKISGLTDLDLPWKNTEAESYRADDRLVMETGIPKLNYEETQFTADGRATNVRTSKIPLKNPEGVIIGVLGTFEDITERKHAEEEISKLNQELEQRVVDRTAQLEAANKELEAFAYSVSHDLRAPLRHINGFLELLQMKTAALLDAQSQHYMTNISEAARHMSMLIDDLLSFSRMGRQEMSRTQVQLDELVEDILREFKPETEGRDIAWRIAPLPSVIGDRAMLRMVLVNLISNALKYTRPRPRAEIEIGWVSDQEKGAIIFVRDNGVGFDMQYADKLFGVFQRLHRADEFEGTGIGLANVQRIINRHGGRVWAQAEIDHGATFFFSLPYANEMA